MVQYYKRPERAEHAFWGHNIKHFAALKGLICWWAVGDRGQSEQVNLAQGQNRGGGGEGEQNKKEISEMIQIVSAKAACNKSQNLAGSNQPAWINADVSFANAPLPPKKQNPSWVAMKPVLVLLDHCMGSCLGLFCQHRPWIGLDNKKLLLPSGISSQSNPILLPLWGCHGKN